MSRSPGRRRLPTWALLLLVALVLGTVTNLARHGVALGDIAGALAFAGLVAAPLVVGLLWLERRAR